MSKPDTTQLPDEKRECTAYVLTLVRRAVCRGSDNDFHSLFFHILELVGLFGSSERRNHPEFRFLGKELFGDGTAKKPAGTDEQHCWT